MPLFKKRPIEARQYTGLNGNWLEITRWANATVVDNVLVIPTRDGQRVALDGDWVLRSAQGFYPLPDEVFRMMYEPAEPEE